MKKLSKGFTLIEILIVIAIIGVLATIATVAVFSARFKASDTKRKADLSQIGKYILNPCYKPAAGDGEYDLKAVVDEFASNNPTYTNMVSLVPHDPKSGSTSVTNYKYIVADGGQGCALYANLENSGETATLFITQATARGGTGVFKTEAAGWNGTDKFYQISN